MFSAIRPHQPHHILQNDCRKYVSEQITSPDLYTKENLTFVVRNKIYVILQSDQNNLKDVKVKSMPVGLDLVLVNWCAILCLFWD